MNVDTFERFSQGRLHTGASTANLDAVPWKEHKDFPGVFLKAVLAEEHTGSPLSCVLVRIEPGRRIGLHRHPTSVELHEVIAGDGVCVLEGVEMPYAPGSMAVMPRNAAHEVLAGTDGLCLFAKFVATATE